MPLGKDLHILRYLLHSLQLCSQLLRRHGLKILLLSMMKALSHHVITRCLLTFQRVLANTLEKIIMTLIAQTLLDAN